ncbi:MAG: archaemetzincin family Zn-dependent metalloprotease [Bacteroidota bacterium]
MSEQAIVINNHGNFEKDFLQKIVSGVTQEFLLPVTIEESHMDITEFYDPMRRQYDGNRILKELDSHSSSPHLKKIGLFRVDLCIPILTYIFGQAPLNGKTGIASLYRLRNEQYGMKKDESLLLDRFEKVTIHELGHLFGLVHCHVPPCVMRSSTYVEDLDQKSQNLCKKCRTEIHSAMLGQYLT